MQTMRREWINEGKPKDRFADSSADSGRPAKPQQSELQRRPSNSDENATERPNIDTAPTSSSTSPFQHEEPNPVNSQSLQGKRKEVKHDAKGEDSLFISDDEGGDQPSEDDLDALLAEDEQEDSAKGTDRGETAAVKQPVVTNDFDDEMEAMAGMEDMW